MAKLILISSEERQEFELAAFNSIGRHPDNTIQILDRIISKEHAQIQRTPEGRYLLRDLGSLNGTYIRGERVHEQILGDGDEVPEQPVAESPAILPPPDGGRVLRDEAAGLRVLQRVQLEDALIQPARRGDERWVGRRVRPVEIANPHGHRLSPTNASVHTILPFTCMPRGGRAPLGGIS